MVGGVRWDRGRVARGHTFQLGYSGCRGLAAEEVGVAGFFCAGLAGEDCGQRRVSLGQAIKGGDYVVEGFEVIHAVGAAAEFAGGLRAAQEEDADYCYFAAVEVEDFLEAM